MIPLLEIELCSRLELEHEYESLRSIEETHLQKVQLQWNESCSQMIDVAVDMREICSRNTLYIG